MEFETLRESSILAGTDTVEHSSIAKNWTTDMEQSVPYQHKNLLEDAMDTIFKLSCALKEETKNEMSTVEPRLTATSLIRPLYFVPAKRPYIFF